MPPYTQKTEIGIFFGGGVGFSRAYQCYFEIKEKNY